MDARGGLLIAEAHCQVPFDIRRLFVLHGNTNGSSRGHHAHRKQHQFLIMLAGAVVVTIDDGNSRAKVKLNQPSIGLHIPPMLWIELDDFSTNAICAVLASGPYDAADYVRNREEFDLISHKFGLET